MKLIAACAIGLLFGFGLIISGMTDPSKVIGFLDIAGFWNPSLALVMMGAIAVGIVAFGFARTRKLSFLGEPFRLPTATQIDRRLLFGGLVFGVGWGLAGYCPGPALASVLTGGIKPLVFVGAMIFGMAIFEILEAFNRTRQRNHMEHN
jgi:uncharacterized protein